MTEMGVRKPKREECKMVEKIREDCYKCKLKKPGLIKIGRLMKPIVNKLMGKETFILCGF